MILMTATQSTQRRGGPRALHHEQALMWELVWQPSRMPILESRAGPLAWTPSLDGQRLTGRHSAQPRRIPGRAKAMTGDAVPDCLATAEADPLWAAAGSEVSTSGGPAHYEIRVEGVLDSRWAAWFGGLHIERDDTQTVMSGSLADQPALHGLLTKIGDLGLCLISVRLVAPAYQHPPPGGL